MGKVCAAGVGWGAGSGPEVRQRWPVACSAAELRRGDALLIPEGCAHGGQVLETGSDLYFGVLHPKPPGSPAGKKPGAAPCTLLRPDDL